MNGFSAVFRRELGSMFGTPVAYLVLTLFLALGMYLTFEQDAYGLSWWTERQASMFRFFDNLPFLLALLVPAVAMRMWSEERRSGTIELLLNLPITVRQAVLGKFLAAWTFWGVGLLLTAPFLYANTMLGDPDLGPVFTSYLGCFLITGAYLAIAGFCSALSKNQVIAFVLGAAFCVLLWAVGLPEVIRFFAELDLNSVGVVLQSLSIENHFQSLLRGVVELRSIVFLSLVTVAFLWASMAWLETNKAS